MISFDEATQIVDDIVYFLQIFNTKNNFCINYEICGSYRREQKENIKDIDVVIDINYEKINAFMFFFSFEKLLKENGFENIHRFKTFLKCNYSNIPVEFYFAENEEQFEVLKLIKTGSFAFCKDLAERARHDGWMLKFADGLYGIYGSVQVWDKETGMPDYVMNPLRRKWKEKDIIETLYGKYIDPRERNV